MRRSIDGVRGRGQPEWEYLPAGWPDDDPSAPGWAAGSIADTQLARWEAFVDSVRAPAALGLSPEAPPTAHGDVGTHNTVMAFGYVLGLTAHAQPCISMLDWGGGLGQYRVYAGTLLPGIQIDYHCRDLPRLTGAGRQVQPTATFHDTDESALSRTYDLVLASSSLQYSRDWEGTLTRLASVTGRYLYVTRQPLVESAASFVVVQRPHRHGYLTEYPGWFLNRGEFLDAGRRLGLALLREFLIAERPFVPDAPEQADYRGFLFAAPERQGTS